MKILIVNRLMGIRRGGGEYFDYYIARELQRMGNEVKFIVGRRLKAGGLLPLSEFDTVYISTPFLREYYHRLETSKLRIVRKVGSIILDLDLYLFERKVLNYIKRSTKCDFDIVQLCGLWRLGSWIEKRLKIPATIVWHGEPSKRCIKYGRHCSYHIAIGSAYAKVKNYIDANTLKLEPGVDVDLFAPKPESKIREALGLDLESILFLFVGRLIPVKNLSFMLQGFCEVLRENSKIHLLIVGDGPEMGSLIDFVKGNGMAANVTFTGNLRREEMVNYYSASDAFVMTSKYESFPLALLEAMSCSLPVIVPSIGWFPRLIRDGENGKLIDLDNVDSLRQAFSFVANNRAWRREAGARNRNIAREYSWESTAFRLISFYQQVVREK